MDEGFHMKLSSGEIWVLAALLGHESVFGVDEKEFSDAGADMKALAAGQMRRLERRRLIRYDLDGVLYMASGLRQAIDCIGSPEKVGLFSTNLRSGRRSSVYVMEKAGKTVTLERLGRGKYLIRAADDAALKEILPPELRSPRYFGMKEMMLLEEAAYIHQRLEAFDRDGAEARLKKQVGDGAAARTIAGILGGGCGYLTIQVRRREKNLYRAGCHILLAAAEQQTVLLHADENDVLRFEALSPAAAEELIRSQFVPGEKRGAD